MREFCMVKRSILECRFGLGELGIHLWNSNMFLQFLRWPLWFPVLSKMG